MKEKFFFFRLIEFFKPKEIFQRQCFCIKNSCIISYQYFLLIKFLIQIIFFFYDRYGNKVNKHTNKSIKVASDFIFVIIGIGL